MSAWRNQIAGVALSVACCTVAAHAAVGDLDIPLGRALFERLWVAAPASTKSADGLGPLFNARSCASCHKNGGPGRLPERAGPLPAGAPLVLHLTSADGDGVSPHPTLGFQLQTNAIAGHAAEGAITLRFAEEQVTLADGLVVSLRKPIFDVSPRDLLIGVSSSPRLAPNVAGAALLARIPEQTIRAAADQDDANGDGISGIARETSLTPLTPDSLGRFGWKAEAPTLQGQIASAFSRDLGLSTSLQTAPWGDCTQDQTACRSAIHGGTTQSPEVTAEMMSLIAAYLENLGPTATGMSDVAGEKIFAAAGCTSCHTPKHDITAESGKTQTIGPYTDLLLHDMGPALADSGEAAVPLQREWRTAPLWGLHARMQKTPDAQLLHDGRARSPLEAILWHDGEAAAARDRVKALSKDDRDALLRFLESL